MNVLSPEGIRLFRRALGAFATGVTIVTAKRSDGRDAGLTANSFNSVSLDPPMILWSLARSSGSLVVFEEADRFAVHVLASDQQHLSDRFARRGEDKFGGLTVERGHDGTALLAGCSARFECRTVFRYEGGDHVIFVGEVEAFAATGKPPLIYQDGKYGLVVRRPEPVPDLSEADAAPSDLLTGLLSCAYYQMFLPAGRVLDAHGLNEGESLALAALSVADKHEAAGRQAFPVGVGRDAIRALTTGLEQKGLVRSGGQVGRQAFTLTEAGHGVAVELLAVAKSAEAEIVEALEEGEVLLLCQLLRRVVQISRPERS